MPGKQEGVAPDILVIAKGLGGGYQPIGGILVAGRIVEALRHGSGAFLHGHTYRRIRGLRRRAGGAAGDPRRRAARATCSARARGWSERLTSAFGNHRHVGDIRGRGLFRAIELVADRATKAPFDPALKLHERVKARGHGARPVPATRWAARSTASAATM